MESFLRFSRKRSNT